MTLKQAAAKLRSFGMTIRKEDGEYRVNFFRASESTAYFTDDIADAVGTAIRMDERRKLSTDSA